MTKTHHIHAGWLVDGKSSKAVKNVTMTVRDGMISDIRPTSETVLQKGAEITDLSHCSIVPALVDCSVFLMQSPSIAQSKTIKNDLLLKHQEYCYAYGILGIVAHDMMSKAGDISMLQPSIFGNLEIRRTQPIKLYIDESSENECNDEQLSGDYIRLSLTPDIDQQIPVYSAHTKARLSQLLKKDCKKIIAVANGREAVAEAIERGCDAIEQGYEMGEKNLREMARKKILWIPSLLRAKNGLDSSGSGGDICCRFSQRYAAPGNALPGAEAYWQKTLNTQLQQLKIANDLGVAVATGSGAGTTGILHGESMAEEMKLFLKAGYSIEKAIKCASDNGAHFFEMTRLGRLEKGQRATFLATRGTLQQLPRKLSFPQYMYIDGCSCGG